MASPMSWFRKYQKGLLAVFGVLLMVIFLLPNLGTNPGPSVARDKDPVAVTWKGGSLKQSDLERMRYLHNHTVQFQQELLRYAARKKGQPVAPAVPEITPIFPEGADVSLERANEQLFARYLFADQARKLGVEISDAMVDDYIALSAGNVTVTEPELRAIARQIGGGMGSLAQIREHLKLELASRQMQIMAQTGMQYIPNPTTATQYYRRIAEEIECVVLPVSVQDYLARVQNEPSTAELKKLFEEGKQQLPDPTGVEPGFKVPRRVNAQFLVAEFETFLQNEISKLTDEEVQAEYERLVALQDPSVMELETVPNSSDDGPALDAPVDMSNAADGDSPETPATGGSDGAQATTGGDGDPAADKSGEGDQPVPDAAEPAPGSGDGASSDESGDGQFLPVSLTRAQDPEQPEPADAPESTQEPGPETADSPAGNPPSDEPAAGANIDQEPGTAPPAAGAGQTPDAPAAPVQDPVPSRRPRPLKDVAEALKRQMKSEAARTEMQTRIDAAEEEVRAWQSELELWESLPEDDRDAKPAPVTVQQLAAKYGFRAGETGLVDEQKFSEHELGRLFVLFQQRQILPLHAVVFGTFERRRLNEPSVEIGLGNGDLWLYWISEKLDVEARSFDAAKADVVSFWKLQQARHMARAEADNIADQINREGGRLDQRFGGKAFNTGAFTWFTANSQRVELGRPVGVSGAGTEFMRVAFGLAPGKAGVAGSDNGDQVYVIQKLLNDPRQPEELTDRLIDQVAREQTMPRGVMGVSQEEMTKVNRDFMDHLVKSLDIQWPGQ